MKNSADLQLKEGERRRKWNNTTSIPRFLGQRFNNLQGTALLTSLVQYGKIRSKLSTEAGYGILVVIIRSPKNYIEKHMSVIG